MNSSYTFIENDFLNRSERLQVIGEGTYGSVAIYNTPRGRFVIKETKMTHKSLGYPPDFIAEIDALIKFRPLRTVVSIEGVYFDLKEKRGFILLELLDTNLSTWARRTPFEERMQRLRDIIDMIGGTLTIMHRYSFIHNDMKTNNILVKYTSQGPLFKLADFGKATYVVNSFAPYGGVERYSPPFHINVYGAEYWAFMVSLVEVILGGRRMIIEEPYRFYRKYFKHNTFDLKRYLCSSLSFEEYQTIPSCFWNFVGPILANDSSSINQGLTNVGITLSAKALSDVEKSISHSVGQQPGFDQIEGEFRKRMKKIGCKHRFKGFEKLLNKFLFLSSNRLSQTDLWYYAEVAYIIVAKSRAQHFHYFKDQDTFLLFERAFLTVLGFQTVVV